MRVLIHDFAGHPFQIQLSRALAGRGYVIRHAYCASVAGPRGALERTPSDPESLEIRPIRLDKPVEKYSLIKRRLQEIDYGKRLVAVYHDFKPDVAMSANCPLDAQSMLLNACHKDGKRFIFWLQDLIGTGAYRVLKGKMLGVGSLIGRYLMSMEAKMLRRSDEVVLITDDHGPMMSEIGVDRSRVHVIENWAPLEEVSVEARDNPWAEEQGLMGKFCYLYSGTLGMKHNPNLLLQLAARLRDHEDVRVVVISEGKGAQWLKEQKEIRG